jgi:N-acetylglutamate synthase-like GNAT family acetyltransferase
MQTQAQIRDQDVITVRPLRESDLAVADHIMRVAFGTYLGVPDPVTVFGDADYVKTRYLAAPDCAWVAELDGEVVGSNFATRWGTFAFFGPLTVRVDLQDRGIGRRLMEPVMEAFERWGPLQSGLFTFPESAKHIGLYQKHGFWPRMLNPVMAKPATASSVEFATYSEVDEARRPATLQAIRGLTDAVFPGLGVEREIRAVDSQALGDTVLLHEDGELVGVAICHCGGASEAGSGACFVKFGAVRPGAQAPERFERVLDACEQLAADAELERIVAGINTGRIDAYRRMLARGYRTFLVGLAMRSLPEGPDYDGPQHYVIDDLR